MSVISGIFPQLLGHGGKAFHNNASLHRLQKYIRQAIPHDSPVFSVVVRKPKRLADTLVQRTPVLAHATVTKFLVDKP